MPEVRGQRGRRLDRGDAVGVGRGAEEGAGREGDPQAPGRRADLAEERAHPRRGVVGSADVRPADRVERGRSVADRAGQDVLADEPGPALAGERARRVAGARRLEPDEPTVRGRDPDRPAAIATMGQRHHPGGDGGAGAAARAAGGVGGVPRVACRAAQHRLGHAVDAKLGRVGAADDDQPRAAEAPHELRVALRSIVGEELGRLGAGLACVLGHQVLEQHRDAPEGPIRERSAGLGAGPIELGVHDRVQPGVVALDARDRGVDELRGRHVTARDERGEPERVVAFVLRQRRGHPASCRELGRRACHGHGAHARPPPHRFECVGRQGGGSPMSRSVR